MTIKKQSDVNECGLVIVQSLHKEFHSEDIDINELKRNSNMSEKGMSIANLILLGEKYGVKIEAFKGKANDFLANDLKGYYGAMLDNNGMNHYVLFKRVGHKILILDPIKGKHTITTEEFERIFGGVVFEVGKGNFIKEKEDVINPFSLLLKQPTILFTILFLILVSVATTFISSVFMKVIIDTIIPGALKNQLTVIILIFVWVSILNVMSTFMKTFFSKKLTMTIETELTLMYFKKIREASIIDLQKINVSDHLRRISLIESSSAYVSNVFMATFGESITLLVASSIMVWIDVNMFALAAAGGFVIVVITTLFNLFIREKYSDVLEDQLSFLTSSIDGVMSFKELKEPSVGEAFRSSQEKKYEKYKTSEYSLWKMDSSMNVINHLLSVLIPILLIYLSTNLIFDSKISVGSMVMFVSIFHSFISPLESMTHMIAKLPLARKNLKLISYVLNLESNAKHENKKKLIKMSEIHLKDISFGYDRELFKIKDYLVDRNIHISGTNGSGKSSFLNLISGRYDFTGVMKINELNFKSYDVNSVRSKVFMASPTTYLTTGSIYEYITLGNKDAMEVFNSNIEVYNLHKLFDDIGISFEQKISQNGQNLSSGQRQLIILMRLFAFGYDLVILDEAMENIDSKKVKWLSKAINEVQTSIYVEVSHSNKYLAKGKKVKIDEIFETK